VAKVSLGSITWTRPRSAVVQDADQLELNADGSTAALEPGKRAFAKVLLQDGRLLKVRLRLSRPVRRSRC